MCKAKWNFECRYWKPTILIVGEESMTCESSTYNHTIAVCPCYLVLCIEVNSSPSSSTHQSCYCTGNYTELFSRPHTAHWTNSKTNSLDWTEMVFQFCTTQVYSILYCTALHWTQLYSRVGCHALETRQ